jgi:hypothetical protein
VEVPTEHLEKALQLRTMVQTNLRPIDTSMSLEDMVHYQDETLIQAVSQVFPPLPVQPKKPYFSNATWAEIQHRAELWKNVRRTSALLEFRIYRLEQPEQQGRPGDAEQQENANAEPQDIAVAFLTVWSQWAKWSKQNRQTKQCIKQDYRAHVEGIASRAHEASKRNNIKELYASINILAPTRSRNNHALKDDNGNWCLSADTELDAMAKMLRDASLAEKPRKENIVTNT